MHAPVLAGAQNPIHLRSHHGQGLAIHNDPAGTGALLLKSLLRLKDLHKHDLCRDLLGAGDTW